MDQQIPFPLIEKRELVFDGQKIKVFDLVMVTWKDELKKPNVFIDQMSLPGFVASINEQGDKIDVYIVFPYGGEAHTREVSISAKSVADGDVEIARMKYIYCED